MKNVKLLLVFNSSPWKSEMERVLRLREWFQSKLNLQVAIRYTTFPNIPFVYYEPKLQGIDRAWYDNFITPMAKDFDIVLFVVPLSQWPWDKTDSRGWRTDRDSGPVELQIATDEDTQLWITPAPGAAVEQTDTFMEYARHEILHALFMMTGQEDTTHKWIAERQPEKALAEIQFPTLKDGLPEGYLDSLVLWLQKLLAWTYNPVGEAPKPPSDIMPEPIPPIPPTEPKRPSLTQFCLGIRAHEGFATPGQTVGGIYYPTGSLSYRNNNPGNLKYVGQVLSSGADKRGFAMFQTYQDGWLTLKRMVTNAATGKSTSYTPDMTFYGYFGKYAPSSDNNDPKRYAEEVARMCGVPPTSTISMLVVD